MPGSCRSSDMEDEAGSALFASGASPEKIVSGRLARKEPTLRKYPQERGSPASLRVASPASEDKVVRQRLKKQQDRVRGADRELKSDNLQMSDESLSTADEGSQSPISRSRSDLHLSFTAGGSHASSLTSAIAQDLVPKSLNDLVMYYRPPQARHESLASSQDRLLGSFSLLHEIQAAIDDRDLLRVPFLDSEGKQVLGTADDRDLATLMKRIADVDQEGKLDQESRVRRLLADIDAYILRFPSSRSGPTQLCSSPKVAFLRTWVDCTDRVRTEQALLTRFMLAKVDIERPVEISAADVDKFLERELRSKSPPQVVGRNGPLWRIRTIIGEVCDVALDPVFVEMLRGTHLVSPIVAMGGILATILTTFCHYLRAADKANAKVHSGDASARHIILGETLHVLEAGGDVTCLVDRILNKSSDSARKQLGKLIGLRDRTEELLVGQFGFFMNFLETELLEALRDRPYNLPHLLESDRANPLSACHLIPRAQRLVAERYCDIICKLLHTLGELHPEHRLGRELDNIRWGLKRIVRFTKRLVQRIEVSMDVTFPESMRQLVSSLSDSGHYLVVDEDDEAILSDTMLVFVSSEHGVVEGAAHTEAPKPDHIYELMNPLSSNVDSMRVIIARLPDPCEWNGQRVAVNRAKFLAAFDTPADARHAIGGAFAALASVANLGTSSSSSSIDDANADRESSNDDFYVDHVTKMLEERVLVGHGVIIAPDAHRLHELLRDYNVYLSMEGSTGLARAVLGSLQKKMERVREAIDAAYANYIEKTWQYMEGTPSASVSASRSSSSFTTPAATPLPAALPLSPVMPYDANVARAIGAIGSLAVTTPVAGRPMTRTQSSPSRQHDAFADRGGHSRMGSMDETPLTAEDLFIQALSSDWLYHARLLLTLTSELWPLFNTTRSSTTRHFSERVADLLVEILTTLRERNISESLLRDAYKLTYNVMELTFNDTMRRHVKDTSRYDALLMARHCGFQFLDSLKRRPMAPGMRRSYTSYSTRSALSRSTSAHDLRDRAKEVMRMDADHDYRRMNSKLIGKVITRASHPLRPSTHHTFAWTLLDQSILGRGTFGIVYKALNRTTWSFIAVKVIPAVHLQTMDARLHVVEDIDSLVRLKHERIVQYYGAEERDSVLYILMEYCSEGSLGRLLRELKQFDEAMLVNFCRQILEGLVYLHQNRILHRDLKPDNILIEAGGSLKLADFGSAIIADRVAANDMVGTANYLAPELVRGEEYVYASDIWSFGCTMLHMATGERPWSNFNWAVIYYRIGQGHTPPIDDNLDLRPELRDILQSCFRDKKDRPSASELLRSFVAISK